MLPSIFGENMMDEFFDRDFFGERNPLFGKHARNLMKTDIHENDKEYELSVELPGFKKEEISLDVKDGYLTKMTEQSWDSVVNIILKGAFLCSRAVLPQMMEKKWGRVINISSRSLFGNPGQTNYSAGKAGLVGFTRALAQEQGRFGVTVNAVAPGFIMTPGMRNLPHFPKQQEAAIAKVPVGFLGEPRDISNAVAFLASDVARYISGTTLFVTGGRYSG